MKKQFVLAFAAACMALAASAECRAGFARVDTTPPLGISMPGYFSQRLADGVLDPINSFFTKAFPAITKATGVPRERIYVHSTHTHTGPSVWVGANLPAEQKRLTQEYADRLVRKLAEAGSAALADLAPAKIAVAKTKCTGVSAIRRYRMKDGSVRTNPGITNPNILEPIGTPDETLQVVRFKRTGKPDVAIIHFGTHPDTIGGTKYSADWPGVVRKTFEAGIGGGVKCLFLNGAQGDVNQNVRNPSPGRAALPRPEIHFARMPANVTTADEIKWLALFDAGKVDQIPLGKMEIMTLTSPGSRARTMQKGPDHFDILLSTVAIGDSLAFAGLPCEPFVDIGREIKAQSPFRMTIVSCLTNGSWGYIPATKTHKDGGYEALSSRFAAPTGDRMVAAQVEQLKKLKESK